jgi:uncharacterized membrane protein YobD (UPF0266 family)
VFSTPLSDWHIGKAFMLCSARIFVGLIVALISFSFVLKYFPSSTLNYIFCLAFIILIPVRYIEWLLTTKLIHKVEPYARPEWWILGGVMLSCIMDIPCVQL